MLINPEIYKVEEFSIIKNTHLFYKITI